MAQLRLGEQSATLKPWLFNHLEPISEADPNVLSEYILALLKHDSSAEDLKQLCTSQLEDFLGDETFAFVTKLFHFLSNPPSIPVPSSGPPLQPSPLLHDSARGVKRPFDGNSARQPDAKLARSAQSSGEFLPTGPAAMRREPGPSGSVQARDRWAPTGMASGAGRPLGWQSGAPPAQGPKVAGLCKDYHYKGYCARGDLCQYQHDELPPHISPPPARSPASESRPLVAARPFPSSLPLQQPRPFFAPPPRPPYSPYPSPYHSSPQNASPQNANGPPHTYPVPSRPSFPPRGSGPSTQRPDIRPQSATTLVVENIPRDALNLPSVQQFFGTFGSVVNITIDQPGLRAVVTFATQDQAHRALVSPDAVFGNRFVRVYRQRLDIADRTSSNTSPFPSASFLPNVPTQARPFFPSTSPPLPVPPNPAVEAARHQREAQRKAQTARASQLQANASRQKELMERFDEPGLEAADRSTIMQALRKLASETSSLASVAPATVTTSTPAASAAGGIVDLDPRAQLAQLREEAKALGIDTTTPRGRGRGFARGLGRYARGRGGPPRTFRLDNRTTKLLLRDIPEPSSLPVLRTYFEDMGEVVRLDPVPNTPDFLLEFKTRVSAEQALSRGSTIPGVGRLSMQWSHSPSSASTVTKTGDSDEQELEPEHEHEHETEVKMETDEGERVERDERLSRDDDEEEERSWNR